MTSELIRSKNGYDSLYLSTNRKVKFDKEDKNTFGLNYGSPKFGGTCPHATKGKGGCLELKGENGRHTCYMSKVTSLYKQVGTRLNYNTELLQNATSAEQVTILRNTILKWLLNGGYKNQFFRLHYSGDFYDKKYLNSWVKVIKEFPNVKFWVYTRSFWAINKLSQCKNIAVYISADPVNWKKARLYYNKYKDRKNVGMAKMGQFDAGEDIKFVTCPETSGVIKNEEDQGACAKCGLCYKFTDKIKLRNITFNIH